MVEEDGLGSKERLLLGQAKLLAKSEGGWIAELGQGVEVELPKLGKLSDEVGVGGPHFSVEGSE